MSKYKPMIQYRCEKCNAKINTPGVCRCQTPTKDRPVSTPEEIDDRILEDAAAVPDPTTGMETRQPSDGVWHETEIDMYITVPVRVRTQIVSGMHTETLRIVNGSKWAETVARLHEALKTDSDIDAFVAGLNVKANQ